MLARHEEIKIRAVKYFCGLLGGGDIHRNVAKGDQLADQIKV